MINCHQTAVVNHFWGRTSNKTQGSVPAFDDEKEWSMSWERGRDLKRGEESVSVLESGLHPLFRSYFPFTVREERERTSVCRIQASPVCVWTAALPYNTSLLHENKNKMKICRYSFTIKSSLAFCNQYLKNEMQCMCLNSRRQQQP